MESPLVAAFILKNYEWQLVNNSMMAAPSVIFCQQSKDVKKLRKKPNRSLLEGAK